MIQRPFRVLAVLLLLCMVAAQAHFCFDASAARNTRHQCQMCKSGGWAVQEPDVSLDAQLASNPLQEIACTDGEHHPSIETSSSRAPPRS
jgi:hypothetical protein